MMKNPIGRPLSKNDMKNINGGSAPAGELWSCTPPSGGTIELCWPGTQIPDCGFPCSYVTLCSSGSTTCASS